MSKKKKPQRSRAKATVGFFENLTAGNYNPVQRAMRIAGNLARRDWLGRGQACCGNYGDPGC